MQASAWSLEQRYDASWPARSACIRAESVILIACSLQWLLAASLSRRLHYPFPVAAYAAMVRPYASLRPVLGESAPSSGASFRAHCLVSVLLLGVGLWQQYWYFLLILQSLVKWQPRNDDGILCLYV